MSDKTSRDPASNKGLPLQARLACMLDTQRLISLSRRVAFAALAGAIATPACFFWFAFALEPLAPDLTLAEFAAIPYMREFIFAWTIGSAIVFSVVNETGASSRERNILSRLTKVDARRSF